MTPTAKRRFEGAAITLLRAAACTAGIIAMSAAWDMLLPYLTVVLAIAGLAYSFDALRRRW
jgi:hypothetical protein